jgi:hypothetical protein
MPALVLEIFGVVMLVVAEVSAAQLVVAHAWTRRGGADIAVSYLLTGIAVAGILLPGLRILPHTAWEVVFAVVTAWFVWCLWRERRGHAAATMASGHYAPHLADSAALLYLFAALAGPSAAGSGLSMSGTGGTSGMAWGSSGGTPTIHAPTLALIFALLLVAFTVHDLDRRARVDGYFQVVGRRFVRGEPALAAAATGPVALRPPIAAHTAERLLFSPAVVKACRVATSLTIAFILIILI